MAPVIDRDIENRTNPLMLLVRIETKRSIAKITAVFREIGDRTNEAEALKNLAELHQPLGEVEVAQQSCQQALELATELGIPLAAECEALQLKIENAKLKMEGEKEG